jgi:hypothetical protein
MSFHSWLRNFRSALASGRGRRHDRRRDSLRAATRRPKLEVLEDRSLLSFSPVTSFPVGTDPRAVVTADFNNDGHLDLATSNYDPTTGSSGVSVLLGDGQGGFGAPWQSAGGTSGGSLAAGDFNGDGKLDLVTTHVTDVRIRLGNGDGTFQSPYAVPLHSPTPPVSVGVADFNADHKMDLVVISDLEPFSGTGGWIEVLQGNGAGAFPAFQVTEGSPVWPSLLAIDDLNADGTPDVVLSGYWDGNEAYVEAWQGDASGILWLPYWTFNSGGQGSVGDFTGDGILDLVIAGQTVDVLAGLGDGTFAAPISNPTSGNPAGAVEVADFNGDGKLDVVMAAPLDGSVSVLLGNGDGTLSYAGAFATGSSPAAVAVGDFNADGRPDVATANAGSNTFSVLLNDGAWTAPPAPELRIGDRIVTEGNTGTASATFTVTLSAPSTQPVSVAYSTGNGTATAGSDFQAASGTLTFAPGQTSKTITVLVNGDRAGEPNETFVVNLSSPTNAIIIDGQGAGTILDDEPRVSVSDVTKAEGKNGKTTAFVFTVTLSAAYDQPVTVSFRTVDGTAKTGDKDYTAKSGTLTFAPGETTKTVTIEVKGDNKRESNETFNLDLSGLSSNALFTKNRGLGTILNDD